jgi:hypothetical protein
MDKKEKAAQLTLEREELNRLIGRGATFTVEDVRFHVEKRFFGLWRKKAPETYKREFRIEEPTLGTLDRLAREWVELEIDEEKLKGTDGMRAARTMAARHAMRCAKVVAIAVMGSDYLIPKFNKGGFVTYKEDDKTLGVLTALFYRTIKPSLLHQLVILISTMCNLADFINSIRLMSCDRTTMPTLVEENPRG